MRLEQYIKESLYGSIDKFRNKHRSVEMKSDEFIAELTSSKYSDMLRYLKKGGTPMYRGGRYEYDYLYIDPYQSKPRESMYTSNYYTLLMSKLPSWKNFPPREYAIIGSTGYSKARSYGSGVNIVIPQNGSKIGIANSSDLWGSFGKYIGDGQFGDGPLGDMNNSWSNLFHRTMDSFDVINEQAGDELLTASDKFDYKEIDSDIHLLKKACDVITKIYNHSNWNTNSEWKLRENDSWYNFTILTNTNGNFRMDVIGDLMKKHGDMWKVMSIMYDPKINKFRLAKPGDKLPRDVEVWTDGKSLIISEDEWLEIKGTL